MNLKKFLCMASALAMTANIAAVSAYAADKTVKVTFVDGEESYSIDAEVGKVLHELPAHEDLTRIFDGWYKDEEGTEEFLISEEITEPLTLYAKWSEIEIPFDDVKEDDIFYKAVQYVYFNEIMNGVEETVFAPDKSLNRAMLVTILHRMEGTPIVNFAMNFSDVKDGEYYTEAVRWAQSTGIVKGVSDTEFAPETNITREQLAAIIYRYAEGKGIDVEKVGEDTNTLDYNDIMDISEYAGPAIHFCLATGIMSARESEMIMPAKDATRAEAAMALTNFALMQDELLDASIDYTVFEGEYQDSASQRAMLTATPNEENSLDICVKWSSSAKEYTQWDMKAKYYDENKLLTYTDSTVKTVTTNEKGEESEEIVSEGEAGYFTVDNGKLLWNGTDDEECQKCVFEKMTAEVANPMVETDKDGISKELGIKLYTPNDAENAKYFIINKTLGEIRFTFNTAEISVRAKAADEFEDVSGVYLTWDNEEAVKVKDCEGKVLSSRTDDTDVDVCLWYDKENKVMYSAYASAADLSGFDIQAIAEQAYASAK